MLLEIFVESKLFLNYYYDIAVTEYVYRELIANHLPTKTYIHGHNYFFPQMLNFMSLIETYQNQTTLKETLFLIQSQNLIIKKS